MMCSTTGPLPNTPANAARTISAIPAQLMRCKVQVCHCTSMSWLISRALIRTGEDAMLCMT